MSHHSINSRERARFSLSEHSKWILALVSSRCVWLPMVTRSMSFAKDCLADFTARSRLNCCHHFPLVLSFLRNSWSAFLLMNVHSHLIPCVLLFPHKRTWFLFISSQEFFCHYGLCAYTLVFSFTLGLLYHSSICSPSNWIPVYFMLVFEQISRKNLTWDTKWISMRLPSITTNESWYYDFM